MSDPIETEQPAPFTPEELARGEQLFELYKAAGEYAWGMPSAATWEDQGDGQKVWARFGQLLTEESQA